jgi:hypothetical protein
MKRNLVLAGVLAFVGLAPSATAQVTLGWDAAVFSSYVWRGVTYTNKPVLQPDVYLTFPLGKASLTAGGWANIDIAKYDGSTDISESGGASAFNLAEFDWWGEIGVPVGVATLTGGVTGYIYPNDVGLIDDFNTVEVYGKVALGTPLSPKVSAYYDVDKVKGVYIEGGVSHGLPLGASTLTLGALAGWTGGQEIDSDFSSNFDDKGLTHADLFASMGFSAGPVTITPAIHGVIGNDRRTKYTKLANNAYGANDTSFKVWGGVTISWSKAFGGSEEKGE